MDDRDDLAPRLEALGSTAAPPLSDSRRSAIEARVLASASSGDVADVPADRRRWAMALASAAVLTLLVVGAVVALGGRSAATELDAVSGTVAVELPDGQTLDGVVGTGLPDGSVIDVAAGASATVDGVVLPPGRYAVVGGRPEPLSSAADTSTTTTTTTTTIGGPTTSTSTPDASDTGTPVAPTRTTTTLPVRPTTTISDRPPVRPTTTIRPTDRPTTTTLGPPVTVDRPTTTDRATTTTVARPPTTTTTILDERSRDR